MGDSVKGRCHIIIPIPNPLSYQELNSGPPHSGQMLYYCIVYIPQINPSIY